MVQRPRLARRRLACRVARRCLAAPFCFTWIGLLAFCVLSWMTGGLGICLGYHRLLTHGSFQTYRLGPPRARPDGHLGRRGAADHLGRRTPQAPSLYRQAGRSAFAPRRRLVEPHPLALSPARGPAVDQEMHTTLRKDLLKDPVHAAAWTRPSCFGTLAWARFCSPSAGAAGTCARALSLLVWGMFLRLVYVLHITWARQFGLAHVGLPQLRHARQQPQPLVGRPAGLRRRLAQQPPRLPRLRRGTATAGGKST